jgi:hypothetical protein
MGSDTVRRILLSFIYGPVVSLYAYINAPIESLQELRSTWPLILALFILLTVLLVFLRKEIKVESLEFNKSGWLSEWNRFPKSYLYLCVVGILMMVVGYLFAFTHFPPKELVGRRTSVHFGASFGSLLFFVSAWLYLFSVVRGKRFKNVLVFILIGWISLMGARGNLVQNDFAKSWEFQKRLIDQVFTVASDMDEGDLILLENQNLVETKYILSYGWPLPGIPEYLIEFPRDFESPPRIVLSQSDPEKHFFIHDSKVCFVPAYPFLYDNQDTVTIRSGDLIYLKMEGEEVIRVNDNPFFESHGIEIKNAPESDHSLPYDMKLVYRDFELE